MMDDLFGKAYQKHRAGNFSKAEELYKKILRKNKAHIDANYMLGTLYAEHGRLQDARIYLEKASQLSPDSAMIQNNLGNVYRFLSELEPAAVCFKNALNLQPDMPEAMNNLGNVRIMQGRLHEAATLLRRVVELNPSYAPAYVNLGNALKEQGRIDEALAQYRGAIKYQPDLATAYSNYLMTLSYSAKPCGEIFEEHRHWGKMQSAHADLSRDLRKSEKLKLNLGYVSPDLHDHPVGYLLKPVLNNHNRAKFKVFSYSDSDVNNAMTKALQASVDVWRDTRGMSNTEVARQIKKDAIDILIDLSGHSANNRLQVFVEKPAPVQIAYLGYPATTGLSQIDYIISDRWLDGDDAETQYVEQKYLLDRPFFCYEAPSVSPELTALPASRNGFATFGSFNTFSKISGEVLDLWAKILCALPNAKIILQARGLDEPETRQAVIKRFDENDVSAERIALYGLMPFQEHLKLLQAVDIALDTFPWNGHMTSLNCLWMGVPVVTRSGTCRAGRMGMDILHSLQLDDFVAASSQAYIDKAIAAVADVDKLNQLRQGMRQRILSSPICDIAGFVNSLENAYRACWQESGNNPS